VSGAGRTASRQLLVTLLTLESTRRIVQPIVRAHSKTTSMLTLQIGHAHLRLIGHRELTIRRLGYSAMNMCAVAKASVRCRLVISRHLAQLCCEVCRVQSAIVVRVNVWKCRIKKCQCLRMNLARPNLSRRPRRRRSNVDKDGHVHQQRCQKRQQLRSLKRLRKHRHQLLLHAVTR